MPIGGPVSYEDFLAQSDEDLHAEWVDGRIIPMSPASIPHQKLSGFLLQLLQSFAEAHDLGLVLAAPVQMKTGTELPGREPDILFLAREHLDRLRKTHLLGPADLVVEIVSPESRLRDRGEKFAEYEIGGVPEYWLLDPEMRRADFYQLDADGRYRRAEPDEQGVYRSRALEGFWIRLEWLFNDPLPGVLGTLVELGLVRLG